MSPDFSTAQIAFKDNCKAMLQEMQVAKNSGLAIYDNQMSLFAKHALEDSSANTKVSKNLKTTFLTDMQKPLSFK